MPYPPQIRGNLPLSDQDLIDLPGELYNEVEQEDFELLDNKYSEEEINAFYEEYRQWLNEHPEMIEDWDRISEKIAR